MGESSSGRRRGIGRTSTRATALLVILMLVGSACSIGGNDKDPTATPEATRVSTKETAIPSSGATQAADEATPTPGATEASDDPTATPGATETAVDGSTPVSVPQPTSASVAPQPGACPAPTGYTDSSVHIGLQRVFTPGSVVSFGLPLPAGTPIDAASIIVTANGAPVDASVRVLLQNYDANGAPTGPRSVLIQAPASVLQGDCGGVDVTWQAGSGAGSGATGPDPLPFAQVSADSDEVVNTAERTIEEQNGQATLVETSQEQRVLFTAKEPDVLATFPDGYLTSTGILGHTLAASQIGDDLDGIKFISDQVTPFGLSAMYQESYALNPDSVIGPDDIDEANGITGYEAWLYDRCATFVLFAAQTGDVRFLREAYRSCSYYAAKIELNGDNRGIFTGKPDPDPKYSHLRGLYMYYALTGDEAALTAGEAIAGMWLNDPIIVTAYREGHLVGPDHLWTERLLGTSIEGLYYGQLLTGNVDYLHATQEMVDTAYLHITGDAATLAQINPGSTEFPPQNCFIHNAAQAAEGNEDEPWCSGWMQELLVDSLLAYQDQTGDNRVDEIFIRLTRFLRDTGTSYFKGDLLDDDFLHPSVAFDPTDEENPRILVPLYGAGIDADGNVQHYGEYDDFEHCPDATALTSAGIRALKRTGGYDQNPIGPFASEGESFLALHNEFAFCSEFVFKDQTRLHRDPASFTSDELAEGVDDPAAFIADNKIGYQSHNVNPQRKLSWWFNTSLEQFALLKEAGVSVTQLQPGAIEP